MSELFSDDGTDARHRFESWVKEVRDPAKQNSEGRRVVSAGNGKGFAEYEIAKLPDGSYAVRFYCEYRCGTFSGRSCPWTPFQTRDECVEHFLQSARNHFSPDRVDRHCADMQKQVQMKMQDLLTGSLFGFVEPEPEAGQSAGSQ